MDKDTIERLKRNEKPLGLLSEEEREALQEFAVDNEVEIFNDTGKWVKCKYAVDCHGYTYRIPPDYKPEPEVERCEVELSDGFYVFYHDDSEYYLSDAPDFVDFIGYEYNEGDISNEPRLYNLPDTSACYPKYVLFKKSQAAS